MIKVGIFGASGYTGFESLSILRKHPAVELVFATSESAAGQKLSDLYPVAWDIPLIPLAYAWIKERISIRLLSLEREPFYE